jgi:hypothetical protein
MIGYKLINMMVASGKFQYAYSTSGDFEWGPWFEAENPIKEYDYLDFGEGRIHMLNALDNAAFTVSYPWWPWHAEAGGVKHRGKHISWGTRMRLKRMTKSELEQKVQQVTDGVGLQHIVWPDHKLEDMKANYVSFYDAVINDSWWTNVSVRDMSLVSAKAEMMLLRKCDIGAIQVTHNTNVNNMLVENSRLGFTGGMALSGMVARDSRLTFHSASGVISNLTAMRTPVTFRSGQAGKLYVVDSSFDRNVEFDSDVRFIDCKFSTPPTRV